MPTAQYIVIQIPQSDGVPPWYLQQVPKIEFTADRELALKMDRTEVLSVLGDLMTMQGCSSWEPPVFAVECVLKKSDNLGSNERDEVSSKHTVSAVYDRLGQALAKTLAAGDTLMGESFRCNGDERLGQIRASSIKEG